MSDRDSPEEAAHPAALLLPWYVNGSLSASERQEVDDHLRGCEQCRDELEALSGLAGQMKSSWAKQPAPAPDLRNRVLSKIQHPSVVSLAEVRERAKRDAPSVPARRTRSIFPALAASVIVVQFAAILFMMRSLPPEVIPRGIAAGSTQIKIVFQPAATEGDIRKALLELHARIVGGPDESAAYIVQLTNVEPAQSAKQLAALGRRKELIQRIELAAP
jgi:anti-sigma factor RsiW